jgi:hypothetical protein
MSPQIPTYISDRVFFLQILYLAQKRIHFFHTSYFSITSLLCVLCIQPWIAKITGGSHQRQACIQPCLRVLASTPFIKLEIMCAHRHFLSFTFQCQLDSSCLGITIDDPLRRNAMAGEHNTELKLQLHPHSPLTTTLNFLFQHIISSHNSRPLHELLPFSRMFFCPSLMNKLSVISRSHSHFTIWISKVYSMKLIHNSHDPYK